jgi:hypothetical protein
MTHIKLAGMSKIFYCIEIQLSNNKRSGSRVVSIKHNMNFNFQWRSTFVFLVSHKYVLIKSC